MICEPSSSTKDNVKFCTYNCQGLNDNEKQETLIDFFFFKNFDICCLTELKLNPLSVKNMRKKCLRLGLGFFSDQQSINQAAIILSGSLLRYLTEVSVKKNYVSILLSRGKQKLRVISLYYPTGQAENFALDEEIKTITVSSQAKGEGLIVAGDLNVAIQPEERLYTPMEGPARFTGGFSSNSLIGSLINLGTIDIWKALNPEVTEYTHYQNSEHGTVVSRLDYFLGSGWPLQHVISSKILKNDRPVSSSHVPVFLELKWPLKAYKRLIGRNVVNSKACTSDHWELYKKRLEENYNEMDPGSKSRIDEEYSCLKKAIITAAKETLPQKRQKRIEKRTYFPCKAQIFLFQLSKYKAKLKNSQQCCSKIDRLLQKIKIHYASELPETTSIGQNYLEMLKITKNFLKSKLKEAKKLAKKEAIEKVLRSRSAFSVSKDNAREILSKVLEKQRNGLSIESVKHSEGLETHPSQVKKLTKMFFEALFSETQPLDLGLIEQYHPKAQNIMEIAGKIKDEELSEILKRMGKNKAPGISGITVEMISNMTERLTKAFLSLLDNCLVEGVCPENWCINLIIPLPKGSNFLGDLNQIRPITLLEVPKKIFLAILTHRICNGLASQNLLSGINYGYSKGISASFASLSLKSAIDQAQKRKQQIIIAKLDIKKAFDSVPSVAIIASLARVGVPDPIIKLLSDVYSKRQASVATAFGLTESFPIRRGIEQGGTESPLLWILFMDALLRKLESCGPFFSLNPHSQYLLESVFTPRKLNNITFVDDMTLISESKSDCELSLGIVIDFLDAHGMALNLKKSSIYRNRYGEQNLGSSIMGIEVMDDSEFEILGTTLDINGGFPGKSLQACLQETDALFSIINSKFLPLQMHRYILNSVVLPKIAHKIGPYMQKKILNNLDQIFRHSIIRASGLPKNLVNSVIFHPELLGYIRPSGYLLTDLLLKEKDVLTKPHYMLQLVQLEERLASLKNGSLYSLLSCPIKGNCTGNFITDLTKEMEKRGLSLRAYPRKRTLREILAKEYETHRRLLKKYGLTFLDDVWDDLRQKSSVKCPKSFLKTRESTRILQILRSNLRDKNINLHLIDQSTNGPLKVEKLWTDGSYDPIQRRMGCGIVRETDERRTESSFLINLTCYSSTTAELAAILFAVEDSPTTSTIFLHTDSENAIRLISKGPVRGHQNPLVTTIINTVQEKNLNLKLIKVKAHAEHDENNRADSLAKMGLKLGEVRTVNLKALMINPLFMIKSDPIWGNIRKGLNLHLETTLLAKSHKKEPINKFLLNLPDQQEIKKAIQRCLFSCEDRQLQKFTIRRIIGELPTSLKKQQWYGDQESPLCRLCREIEDQEHLFRCRAKDEIVKRLHKNLEIILHSYDKKLCLPLETFTKFIVQGYISKDWLEGSIPQMELNFKIELIKSVLQIITRSCFLALWKMVSTETIG